MPRNDRIPIFLDIDGVLIRGVNGSIWNGTWEVAPHAAGFLDWAISSFDPIWLSARDKDGSGNGVISAFNTAIGGNDRLTTLARSIRSQAWERTKTTAFDFSRPFLWIDDCPRTEDLLALEMHGCIDQWIEVNTDLRPDDLLRAMHAVAARG